MPSRFYGTLRYERPDSNQSMMIIPLQDSLQNWCPFLLDQGHSRKCTHTSNHNDSASNGRSQV